MSRHSNRCQTKSPRDRGRGALCLTLLAMLALTPPPSRADEVDLTSGRTLRGIVDRETSTTVEILVAGLNRLVVPREEVLAIRRVNETQNTLLMGHLLLEQGALWEAAGHHSRALSLGADPAEIAAPLLVHPTAFTVQLGALSSEQAAEIKNLYLRVLGDLPASDDVLHLAGRLCEVTGDRARARDAYERIPPAWWHSHDAARHDAVLFYQSDAREALAREDFSGVLGALEQMTVLDLTLADRLRPVYLIHWANNQIEQGHWAEAIEMVGENVAVLAPEIARLWLESVFIELEHRPLSGESLEAVVPIFTRYYPRHFPDNAEERIAALFLKLGEEHLTQGEYADARAAFNRHADIMDPNAPVRPRVLAASLLEELAGLARDNWEERLRVTQAMVDAELWREALDELAILGEADDADIRLYATQQRHAIQGDLAQANFTSALDLYGRRQYAEALDRLAEGAELFHEARLDHEVNELRALCQRQINEEANSRALQALADYQQAERHFVMGRQSQAIILLEAVLRDYPDTPVAEDAAVMLRTARRHLAVRHPSMSGFEFTTAEDATPEGPRGELEEMLDTIGAPPSAEDADVITAP